MAPLAAVGFMKLAVDRRAVTAAVVPVVGLPVGLAAVESRMLSVAVEVLVGEGVADERDTSLFDRLK